MKVLNAKGMRLLEAAAVEEGLDYLRLMENAGSAAARQIRALGGLAGAAPLSSAEKATMAGTASLSPASFSMSSAM